MYSKTFTQHGRLFPSESYATDRLTRFALKRITSGPPRLFFLVELLMLIS